MVIPRFLVSSVLVRSPIAVLTLAISIPASNAADTIYRGGTILTLDGNNRTVEAVAVRDGTILACGSLDEVRALAAASATQIDLRSRTLLPGFYAAHDHFLSGSLASFYHVDLNSPPIGTTESIDDIIAALRERAAIAPAGEWVVGRGYDDTLIREKRHPTRHD